MHIKDAKQHNAEPVSLLVSDTTVAFYPSQCLDSKYICTLGWVISGLSTLLLYQWCFRCLYTVSQNTASKYQSILWGSLLHALKNAWCRFSGKHTNWMSWIPFAGVRPPVSMYQRVLLDRQGICRCCPVRRSLEVLRPPNHGICLCWNRAVQQETSQTLLFQPPLPSVSMENLSDTQHSGENITMMISEF